MCDYVARRLLGIRWKVQVLTRGQDSRHITSWHEARSGHMGCIVVEALLQKALYFSAYFSFAIRQVLWNKSKWRRFPKIARKSPFMAQVMTLLSVVNVIIHPTHSLAQALRFIVYFFKLFPLLKFIKTARRLGTLSFEVVSTLLKEGDAKIACNLGALFSRSFYCPKKSLFDRV